MADKKLSLQRQEQIYIEQYRKLQPKTKLTDKQIAELFHASKKNNADKMKGTMVEREKKNEESPAKSKKPVSTSTLLQNKINKLEKDLKKEEDSNGPIGAAWGWIKNKWNKTPLKHIVTLDSSDQVRDEIKKEKKILEKLKKPGNEDAVFKELTGLDATPANKQKFRNGEVKLKSETHLEGYKEGQKIAVDVASDIVSGIVSFAVAGAAIAAVPATFGASLLALPAVGALTKIGVKYLDAKVGGREYKVTSHDLLMGAVNGAIAPFTAGLGGAAGKAVATRLGLEAVKEGGKAIAKAGVKQVVSQTTKQAAKQGLKRTFKSAVVEGLKNPAGYKFIANGVKNGAIKKAAAYMTEGAVDGALSGGIYSGVETAHNGGSAGEILQATVLGTVMGAGMGGVMNTGMKQGLPAVGKMFKGETKATGEAAADAIETSVVKNADEVVPTPKPQGKKSKVAQDAAPAPKTETTPKKTPHDALKPQGVKSKVAQDAAPAPKAKTSTPKTPHDTPKPQGVKREVSQDAVPKQQVEHTLTASEQKVIQKAIKNLSFLDYIEMDKPELYREYVEKIRSAVTKNSNGDIKLIKSRISAIDKDIFYTYIKKDAKNIDIILDNTNIIKEIEDNIDLIFAWNTSDVIKGINKDNLQKVLQASRSAKQGNNDAINYLHYIDYSQTNPQVKYGTNTVEVDTNEILNLLCMRKSSDSTKFDKEISKLFTEFVDMREKKAYGKSLAGIIEQKPELLDIVEKLNHMTPDEYIKYINNLFTEGKLPKKLAFKTFEPSERTLEAETPTPKSVHDAPKQQGATKKNALQEGNTPEHAAFRQELDECCPDGKPRFSKEEKETLNELWNQHHDNLEIILNAKNTDGKTPLFSFVSIKELADVLKEDSGNIHLINDVINSTKKLELDEHLVTFLIKELKNNKDKFILSNFISCMPNDADSRNMRRAIQEWLINPEGKNILATGKILGYNVKNIADWNTSARDNLNIAIENGNLKKFLSKQLKTGYHNFDLAYDKTNDAYKIEYLGIDYNWHNKELSIDWNGNITEKKHISYNTSKYNNRTLHLKNGGQIVTKGNKDRYTSGFTKEYKNAEGIVTRKEEIKPSRARKGEFDITVSTLDKNGKLVEERVGYVKQQGIKIDENGNRIAQKSRRKVKSTDGTVTRQIKSESPKRHGSTYKVIDKDGNVLYCSKRSHIKIDKNHYVSMHNGQRYDITFNKDKITVKTLDKNGAEKTVTLDSEIFDKKLIPLMKKLPGDYLVQLKELDIKVKYKPELESSHYLFDSKTIEMNSTNSFTFAHEFGHALDHLKLGELENDKEFVRLYNEALENFRKKATDTELKTIDYFIKNDGKSESVAEMMALISGLNDETAHLGVRSVVFQQHLAKPLAYAAKKLDMPIEEFAQVGRNSSDLGMAAIQPTAPRKSSTNIPKISNKKPQGEGGMILDKTNYKQYYMDKINKLESIDDYYPLQEEIINLRNAGFSEKEIQILLDKGKERVQELLI